MATKVHTNEPEWDQIAMKYLITGGAGFVGSHLSRYLVNNGNEIVILDDVSTGRIENVSDLISKKSVTFRSGSILDESLVDDLIEGVDKVFHLAAAVGVFNIIDHPLRSLRTNIRGSENVVEACARHRKPLLVTSTSEIYGKNTGEKLSETSDRILGSPLISRWSYSEAKAIEEILAFSLYNEFSIPVWIVRLFNTVGPGQVGKYGMVLPRFISAALSNEPIEIFGDGSQTRCFAHVADVVDAIIRITDSSDAIGKAVNIGNPQETSILSLAQRVVQLLNSKSKIKMTPYDIAYAPGFEEMQRRVPDISLLTSLTQWVPSHSLDEIILDTAQFMRK